MMVTLTMTSLKISQRACHTATAIAAIELCYVLPTCGAIVINSMCTQGHSVL